MLYFPQLESGAVVQYPFTKRRISRTIHNTLGGGGELKLLDAGAERIEWNLKYQNLGLMERNKLEAFFGEAEGRLRDFTWLDPTDNLLVWSGDLAAGAWVKGPLINVVTGISDPAGGASAVRLTNIGSASQDLQQTISGPAWFRYCFSLYARSETSETVTLWRGTEGETAETAHRIDTVWRRVAQLGAGASTAESVTFGLRLAPGAELEIYGLQAEAQPAPSSYRKTEARSGTYPNARFDQDSLLLVSEGPEQHSCDLRIVALVSH